jgi:glycine cleavage system H protein
MMNPEQLLYAKTHEWVSLESQAENKIATVGLSAFAIEALTDLVFMELPEIGRRVAAGESIGEIESVKAVSDIYSPVDGEIVAVNTALPDQLHLLNDDPYGEAWIVKIKLLSEGALQNLLDYAAYSRQCAEGEH